MEPNQSSTGAVAPVVHGNGEQTSTPPVPQTAESVPRDELSDNDDKKRKRGNEDNRSNKKQRHGGFGKAGPRNTGKDMGRKDFQRKNVDKRARNEKEQAKIKAQEEAGARSVLPKPFTEDEIAQDERKPKRKVAVLIGYSGTGYKGMQISTTEKTIEGDLFTAFVKAGAISKANASDPKKSSLVRCARTDKGVHAAGNIVSLKMIVEDPDIVEKINEHLSPQIRVWGITRTIGSFSCYQLCDSRWYEYLLPTHTLVPPHPSTFMGRKLVELAEQAGEKEEYLARQADIAGFWENVEEQKIRSILENYDDDLQALIKKALYEEDTAAPDTDAVKQSDDPAQATANSETSATINHPILESKDLDSAIKAIRNAYLISKKAYRVSPERLARLREMFNIYVGTHRFHNYTVKTTFKDSSAKRHIKSITVSDPFERNGTEWVSIKLHGQSFMMHQIRKMVGMAANIVRCGTSTDRMRESFGDVMISIPKAPGLGLLLERPVFESYNKKVGEKFQDKEQILFDKHEEAMEEFKQREIYDRIFREEEETNQFHGYALNVDTMRENVFLYLTSGGTEASRRSPDQKALPETAVDGSDDEDVVDVGTG